MRRKQLLADIDAAFARWRAEVRSAGRQNRNDASVLSEAVVMHVLNAVYGWSLVNANEDDQNYPAVDLVDLDSRVAVQVTSKRTSKKVQHTLDSIAKALAEGAEGKSLFEGIKRFCVFMLCRKQKTYKLSVPEGIDFDVGRDILDTDDVLQVLTNSAKLSKIEAVHAVVTDEFPQRNNVGRRPFRAFDPKLLKELERLGIYAARDVEASLPPLFNAWEQFEPLLDKHYRADRFAGRAGELATLDNFIEASAFGYLFVTGSAGLGKTALLATWLRSLKSRGERPVFHFLTRHQTMDSNKPFTEEYCFHSLCRQLMAMHGFTGSLPLERELRRYLYRLLITLEPPLGERLVLVLDGLDEALEDWIPGPDLFPPLPERVHVVFSARPVGDKNWLHDLDLDHSATSLALDRLSREELDEFLSNLDFLEKDQLSAVTEAVWSVTRGDPDYVVDVLAHLEDTGGAPEAIEDLPETHSEYLGAWWDEAYGSAPEPQAFEDLMGTLAVLREPLPSLDLAKISDDDALRKANIGTVLKRARRYLEGDKKGGYQLIRTRIRDLVRDRVEDRMATYRSSVARFCQRWNEAGIGSAARSYALDNGVRHVAEADQPVGPRLAALIQPEFVAVRRARGGTLALIEDLRLAVETAQREADPQRAFRFGWLLAAWRDASAIHVAPPLAPIYVKLGELHRALSSIRELGSHDEEEADATRERIAVALAESGSLEDALKICEEIRGYRALSAKASIARTVAAVDPSSALRLLKDWGRGIVDPPLLGILARHSSFLGPALKYASSGRDLHAIALAVAEYNVAEALRITDRIEPYEETIGGWKFWRSRDRALVRLAARFAVSDPVLAWRVATERVTDWNEKHFARVLLAGPLATTDPERALTCLEDLRRPTLTPLRWLAAALVAFHGRASLVPESPSRHRKPFGMNHALFNDVLAQLDLPAVARHAESLPFLREGILLYNDVLQRDDKRPDVEGMAAELIGYALALVDRSAALAFSSWARKHWGSVEGSSGLAAGLAENSVDDVLELFAEHREHANHPAYESAIHVLADRDPEEAILLIEAVEPEYVGTRGALAGHVADRLGPSDAPLLRRLLSLISRYTDTANHRAARDAALKSFARAAVELRGESALDGALALMNQLDEAQEESRVVRVLAWRATRPEEARDEAMKIEDPEVRVNCLMATLNLTTDFKPEQPIRRVEPDPLVEARLLSTIEHLVASPPERESDPLDSIDRHVQLGDTIDELSAHNPHKALQLLHAYGDRLDVEDVRGVFKSIAAGLAFRNLGEALDVVRESFGSDGLSDRLGYQFDVYAHIAQRIAPESLDNALRVVDLISDSHTRGTALRNTVDAYMRAPSEPSTEGFATLVVAVDELRSERRREACFEKLLTLGSESQPWSREILANLTARLALGNRKTFQVLLGGLVRRLAFADPEFLDRFADDARMIEDSLATA